MAKACANKLQLAALAQACWTVGRRFRRIVTCRGYARSWSRPVVLDGFRYAVEAQLCLWLRYGGPLASPSRGRAMARGGA